MTTVTRLLVREDNGTERLVDLPQGVVRIGRSLDNQVVLADADKGVSRAHAELHVQNGRYVIVDLQSQNGTWLNGLRVQRAEVRPDAEIGIGTYRLRLRYGPAVPVAIDRAVTTSLDSATLVGMKPSPRSAPNASPGSSPIPDLALSRGPAQQPPQRGPSRRRDDPHHVPAAHPATPSRTPFLIGGVAAVALIGIVVGRFIFPSAQGPAPSIAPAGASASATNVVSAPPDPPAQAPVPATDAASPPVTSAAADTRPPAAPATVTAPARNGVASSAAAATRAVAAELPVTRKPGESLQQWRERSAGLQARYAYSKVALDRGDYAAAAGGFAAILLDEPGFLDAPQLLVKARDGLRTAALAAIESGNRLDAAGDWTSAMRKYEQAREIDKSVPGLEDAFKRVRGKIRAAGTEAMKRARLLDAAGTIPDALHEYEKAALWLPVDDPNRDIARARADQLKTKVR
jgi:FHA domain-containing protein